MNYFYCLAHLVSHKRPGYQPIELFFTYLLWEERAEGVNDILLLTIFSCLVVAWHPLKERRALRRFANRKAFFVLLDRKGKGLQQRIISFFPLFYY